MPRVQLPAVKAGVAPLKWSTIRGNLARKLEDQEMAGKREKPEDIVMKLRQVEVLQGQGMSVAEAVRQIGSEPCCAIGPSDNGEPPDILSVAPAVRRDEPGSVEAAEGAEEGERPVAACGLRPDARQDDLERVGKGKLHSTIVLEPMSINGLILRAAGNALIMCDRRLAYRSAAPAVGSASIARHSARFPRAGQTKSV